MTPRHVRALRGAAAAWIATFVAATAHTLAGGGAPSPALVAAAGILATPFAVALIGRRPAAWRVGAAVLAAQAFFHVAFALTAGTDATAVSASHDHYFVSAGGGALPAFLVPDAPMLAGHLVAAAATVVALVSGERMLRALGRGIRSMFSRVRAVAALPAAPRLVAVPPFPARAAATVVLSDVSRRGRRASPPRCAERRTPLPRPPPSRSGRVSSAFPCAPLPLAAARTDDERTP
ncbi:hypothetical protein [Microbacterium cremeum]|uniref:hypothetical protein n=1 Tax=Microbacterium cremeum TaxID=2782169 RepID=UPI0018881028|nr:hypothetical protein [Microbacterium cremeum]